MTAESLVQSTAPAPSAEARASRAGWRTRYRQAVILTDITVIAVALACAQMVKLGRPVTATDAVSVYYLILSAFVATIWLAMLAVYRTRSPRIVGVGVEEYRRVLSATMTTVAVIAVILVVLRPEYARGYLAVGLPLGMLGLLLSRNTCRRFLAGNVAGATA